MYSRQTKKQTNLGKILKKNLFENAYLGRFWENSEKLIAKLTNYSLREYWNSVF